MSFSEGEVFIQTTNLIHTLPLLIVSIELVYCLGINLKKKKSFYDLNICSELSQFYTGKKQINGALMHIERIYNEHKLLFTSKLSNIKID